MKTIGIILIAILFINASFKPAQQTSAAKVYDYVSIYDGSSYSKRIWVSYDGDKFEKIKTESRGEGWEDDNAGFKLINKYEMEGYSLYSNGVLPGARYYLLRREHKN